MKSLETVSAERAQMLENVRLMQKAKEQRRVAELDSDEWEIAYAAQVTFERWAGTCLAVLGGMAGEW